MEYVLSGCKYTPSRVAPQEKRLTCPSNQFRLIAGTFVFQEVFMITQLSVFTENSKGAMLKVSRLISDAGIDIYNVVTNDSAEFGIVRMLVTEPEKGFEVLKSEGYMCKLDKVIGVEIPDEVGSLTKLLDTLDKSYINIDYIYVSYSRDSKTPLAVMKVGGYDEVESSLRSRGYTTV